MQGFDELGLLHFIGDQSIPPPQEKRNIYALPDERLSRSGLDRGCKAVEAI